MAHIDWKAAAWAGLIAGVGDDLVLTLLLWLFQGVSPWAPPRMIAAMVFGQDVLPPPATFDPVLVMTGSTIHFALAIVYAFIIAATAVRLLSARWARALLHQLLPDRASDVPMVCGNARMDRVVDTHRFRCSGPRRTGIEIRSSEGGAKFRRLQSLPIGVPRYSEVAWLA
jgi:hypothetical protein